MNLPDVVIGTPSGILGHLQAKVTLNLSRDEFWSLTLTLVSNNKEVGKPL